MLKTEIMNLRSPGDGRQLADTMTVRGEIIRVERSFSDRFAKIVFAAVVFGVWGTESGIFENQGAASSNWISSGFHVGLWSMPSGSGLEGFRGRLNQSISGSSSGIHFGRMRRRHKIAAQSQDEVGFALIIGDGAHRDAATSDLI